MLVGTRGGWANCHAVTSKSASARWGTSAFPAQAMPLSAGRDHQKLACTRPPDSVPPGAWKSGAPRLPRPCNGNSTSHRRRVARSRSWNCEDPTFALRMRRSSEAAPRRGDAGSQVSLKLQRERTVRDSSPIDPLLCSFRREAVVQTDRESSHLPRRFKQPRKALLDGLSLRQHAPARNCHRRAALTGPIQLGTQTMGRHGPETCRS